MAKPFVPGEVGVTNSPQTGAPYIPSIKQGTGGTNPNPGAMSAPGQAPYYDYKKGIQYFMSVRKTDNAVGFFIAHNSVARKWPDNFWAPGFYRMGDANWPYLIQKLYYPQTNWKEDEIVIVFPVQYCPAPAQYQGQVLANLYESWTQTGPPGPKECNFSGTNTKLKDAVCKLSTGPQTVEFKYKYLTAPHTLEFKAAEAPHPNTGYSLPPSWYPLKSADIKKETEAALTLWRTELMKIFRAPDYDNPLTVTFTEVTSGEDFTIGVDAGTVNLSKSTAFRMDSTNDIVTFSLMRTIEQKLGTVLVGLALPTKDAKTVMQNPVINGLQAASALASPFTVGGIEASSWMKPGIIVHYPKYCGCQTTCACNPWPPAIWPCSGLVQQYMATGKIRLKQMRYDDGVACDLGVETCVHDLNFSFSFSATADACTWESGGVITPGTFVCPICPPGLSYFQDPMFGNPKIKLMVYGPPANICRWELTMSLTCAGVMNLMAYKTANAGTPPEGAYIGTEGSGTNCYNWCNDGGHNYWVHALLTNVVVSQF